MQLWINMSASNDMTAIQDCIDNRLDAETIGDRLIAGVIGEAPSRYSKSPALWNSVFRELSINGIYVPLDVESTRLTSLAAAFRNCDRLLGVNVTVPHKLAILEHLDDIDSIAARIGSVNTVVRTNDGRLIGYNTDGEGFVDSIFKIHPGQAESFLDSLRGADVLLLGAGGSARAVAFHVSQLLDDGKLIICNRTVEQARALADEVRKAGHHVQAIGEEELPYWAPKVTLIINSTTKGQGGGFSLERYSALAPAKPGPPQQSGPETRAVVDGRAAEGDIRRNNEMSLNLASAIPQAVRFYDLIYSPEETVFLRHGRETGHKIMNGKTMIVCQAAIAFANYICRDELRAKGLVQSQSLERVAAIMHQAW